MDIEKLLQGTEYEKDAPQIASKIKNAGLDNEYGIHEIPLLGIIAGHQTFGILQAILKAQESPDMKVSPVAKTLALDAGVDLASVTGSGKDGLIVKSDVEGFIASQSED